MSILTPEACEKSKPQLPKYCCLPRHENGHSGASGHHHWDVMILSPAHHTADWRFTTAPTLQYCILLFLRVFKHRYVDDEQLRASVTRQERINVMPAIAYNTTRLVWSRYTPTTVTIQCIFVQPGLQTQMLRTGADELHIKLLPTDPQLRCWLYFAVSLCRCSNVINSLRLLASVL